MSAKPTLEQRAKAIADQAKTLPPIDERRLGALIDNSVRRTWYRVTDPRISSAFFVAFNPELSPSEAQERYPACTVTPTTYSDVCA